MELDRMHTSDMGKAMPKTVIWMHDKSSFHPYHESSHQNFIKE